jgi:hypothetical protein
MTKKEKKKTTQDITVETTQDITVETTQDITVETTQDITVETTSETGDNLSKIMEVDLEVNQENISKACKKKVNLLTEEEITKVLEKIAKRNETTTAVAGQAIAILMSKGASNRSAPQTIKKN